MKTISIPVNNRPDCLRRVLASIQANPGYRDWQLVFSCEPNQPRCLDVIKLAGGPKPIVSVNSHPRGCWVNTFLAADLAMYQGSGLNLYLEDDYLITTDTLMMVYQWGQSKLPGLICLRRAHERQDVNHPSDVSVERSGLFGCGFAWRSDLWHTIRQAWFASDETGGYRMWDHSIAYSLDMMGIHQWRPLVNRSRGIGTNGTHMHNDNDDPNLLGPAYSGPPIKEFVFT